MPAFKDLTGQVFGRLTVLRRVGRTKAGKAVWLCRCACGKESDVVSCNLASGKTQSCGCLRIEKAAARFANMPKSGPSNPNFKHGHKMGSGRGNPTYGSWQAMRGRCLYAKNDHFQSYGRKGVKICDRWLGARGFENFLADMGERPEDTTLGRFGDVGNYEPGNCAWQTGTEQLVEQTIKRQLQFIAA